MQKEFYCPREVAEIVGVSCDTASAMIERLPHIRVSGEGEKRSMLRIRIAVFDAWLSQQDGYNPSGMPLRAIEGGKA